MARGVPRTEEAAAALLAPAPEAEPDSSAAGVSRARELRAGVPACELRVDRVERLAGEDMLRLGCRQNEALVKVVLLRQKWL